MLPNGSREPRMGRRPFALASESSLLCYINLVEISFIELKTDNTG